IVGYNIDDSAKLAVAALKAGVTLYRAAAGDVIVGKGMESFTITALAPEEKVHYKDANAASLTVLAKYGGFSLLLTGDSGTDSEKRYMKKLEEPVSVLKVAHHGSKYSTSSELLMRALPAAAFISCSKYNSYGHPAPETLARLTEAGTEIFATPQSGMIILIYRGGEYFDVTTFTGR
ncbi:MAG: hypothetical protein J6Y89_00345, partial [Lachnospiraceae bacterium]|nr:hypothetical protein [Lachnospiraceae bacterium]